jgi:hypothetical protein
MHTCLNDPEMGLDRDYPPYLGQKRADSQFVPSSFPGFLEADQVQCDQECGEIGWV